MNFSITITGEKQELTEALMNLRLIMDGHVIADGSVQASLIPTPAAAPIAQAPVAQQPQYTPPVQQAAAAPIGAVPTTGAPVYTMEQLGVAAGPLVDAGRGPELTAWLGQRGAVALTQLDKSLYGDFATYLRSLGAKI